MRTFNLKCKIITPLFLGGAKQQAELRTQSINGILRWWFRIAGGSIEDERRIFGWGGEGANQGLVRMSLGKEEFNKAFLEKEIERTEKEMEETEEKLKEEKNHEEKQELQKKLNSLKERLDQLTQIKNKIEEFLSKSENERIKEIVKYFYFIYYPIYLKLEGYSYLGFSLKANQRELIPEDTTFTLTIRFHPKSTDEDIKKFFCALWLAFNLGNFGSRSRRGLGSVMIEEIKGDFPNNFNLKFKPEDNIEKWLKEQLNYIKSLGFWQARNDIPFVFSENFKIYKVEKENFKKWGDWVEKVQSGRSGRYLKNSWGLKQIINWQEILDFMGFLLMAFRSYRNPDYQNAKNILQGNRTNNLFERPIFGLPLNFFYSSINKKGQVNLINLKQGNENLRRASPLMFKILKFGNNYEGFFIVAKSKFMPGESKLVFSGVDVNLPSNKWKALDEFIKALLEEYNIIKEVKICSNSK